jgi:hypothetical protein
MITTFIRLIRGNIKRDGGLWAHYKAYVAWEWHVFDTICADIKRWWDRRSTWR